VVSASSGFVGVKVSVWVSTSYAPRPGTVIPPSSVSVKLPTGVNGSMGWLKAALTVESNGTPTSKASGLVRMTRGAMGSAGPVVNVHGYRVASGVPARLVALTATTAVYSVSASSRPVGTNVTVWVSMS
jgi:hypothetical protein